MLYVSRSSVNAKNAKVEFDPKFSIELNAHELRAKAKEMLAVAEQIDPELPTEETIIEVLSHLRCALVQTIPSDDQIIMDHVRDSFRLLGGKL